MRVQQGISVSPPSQRGDYSVTTFTEVRLHVKRRVSASPACLAAAFQGCLTIRSRWGRDAQDSTEQKNFLMDVAAHPAGLKHKDGSSVVRVGSVLHRLGAHGHQLHSNGCEVQTATNGGVRSSNYSWRTAALLRLQQLNMSITVSTPSQSNDRGQQEQNRTSVLIGQVLFLRENQQR